MKCYPQGAEGEDFFMKRAPNPRPIGLGRARLTIALVKTIEFP